MPKIQATPSANLTDALERIRHEVNKYGIFSLISHMIDLGLPTDTADAEAFHRFLSVHESADLAMHIYKQCGYEPFNGFPLQRSRSQVVDGYVYIFGHYDGYRTRDMLVIPPHDKWRCYWTHLRVVDANDQSPIYTGESDGECYWCKVGHAHTTARHDEEVQHAQTNRHRQ